MLAVDGKETSKPRPQFNLSQMSTNNTEGTPPAENNPFGLYSPSSIKATAIAIPLYGEDIVEYVVNLRTSFLEILKLVFEKREIDMGESEYYPLVVTVDFLKRLDYAAPAVVSPRPKPETPPSEG